MIRRKNHTAPSGTQGTEVLPAATDQSDRQLQRRSRDSESSGPESAPCEWLCQALIDSPIGWEEWIGAGGTPRYTSAGIERVTGYTREEVRDMVDYPEPLIHEEDRERFAAMLREAAEGGNGSHREFRIRRKDGSEAWVCASWSSVCAPDGAVLGARISLRDITSQRAAEEGLRFRIEFEHLIATLSSEFVKLKSDEINAAIDASLKAIGEFAEVDRSYLFLWSREKRTISAAHEWCAPGILSQRDEFQDIPTDCYPWIGARLEKQEIVHIPHIAELPPEATQDREMLERAGDLSLVLVPMACAGGLVGFLGFDSIRRQKTWSDEIIALLKLAGEMFVGALERKRYDEALHEAHTKLEACVQERTVELVRANNRLERESNMLEKKNLALQELLAQVEVGKRQVAAQVQVNVERIALPILTDLEARTGEIGVHEIELLRSCLNDIASPFISKLDSRFSRLTRRELEICHMIRHGFSCKEIATTLNNATQTVLKQRKMIRRKLGLSGRRVNLAAYLKTVELSNGSSGTRSRDGRRPK